MSAVVRMAIALAIGASPCAVGATTAYARSATAPAYVILEFTVKDPDGFKEYAQRAPATVQLHGGKFLVRPGEIVGLKGDAPSGSFAVLAFDSVEAALAWASSPEYTAIVPMRGQSASATGKSQTHCDRASPGEIGRGEGHDSAVRNEEASGVPVGSCPS